MELKHREVPGEFLKSIPEGIKFIHKHGHDYLVVKEYLDINLKALEAAIEYYNKNF